MRKAIAIALALVLASLLPVAAQSLAELKATYEAAVKQAAAAPTDYTANWEAARAARKYGDKAVSDAAPDWKNFAKAVAKDGMKYGDVAAKLQPNGIEGWYWYGLCVGTYADCVSIVQALFEGLKDKTQKGFEMAYKSDKMYDNGGPMLALGRFWQTIPAIAGQDRKKAEALFTEYIALLGNNADANSNAWYYRGELYKDLKKTAEARADLEKAVALGNKEAVKVLAALK
jgi:tetratricopeptide (TPR) repeat protein